MAPSEPCLLIAPSLPSAVPEALRLTPESQALAVLFDGSGSSASAALSTSLTLVLAQQLTGRLTPRRMIVLTRGALDCNAAHGGAWGLARVMRLEHSRLDTQSTDVRRSVSVTAAPALLSASAEGEVAWSGGMGCVARLRTGPTDSR